MYGSVPDATGAYIRLPPRVLLFMFLQDFDASRQRQNRSSASISNPDFGLWASEHCWVAFRLRRLKSCVGLGAWRELTVKLGWIGRLVRSTMILPGTSPSIQKSSRGFNIMNIVGTLKKQYLYLHIPLAYPTLKTSTLHPKTPKSV